MRRCVFGLLASLPFVAGSALAAPPGAVIANRATLEYRNPLNEPVTVASNLVEVTTAVVRSPASIALTRVVSGAGTWQEPAGPSACFSGGAFVTLPDPVLVGGTVIDPAVPRALAATSAYNLGEAVFIRLADADQNLDFQAVDHAEVVVGNTATGDTETVRLSETGVNTGIFAGYLPSAGGAPVPGDCVLQAAARSDVRVAYTDPADAADGAAATAEFDPVQRVFESLGGAALSGATVELLDAASGLPAVVYGNDGVSRFPAAIESGGAATDSGGTSYVFGPGEFRFPVVPDGDYRLRVTPPPGYAAPSTADPADLQSLPGAPYALGAASFGAVFSKSGELSIAFDIPVDPVAETLFLSKATRTATASPGDFVRYELTLENASAAGIATGVRIVDALPPGLRFVPGSARVNGAAAPDPALGGGLSSLEFALGDLAAAERVGIAYVVEVVGGSRNQELVNRATAYAAAGLVSNEASATIRLTEDLFRSTGTIIGRVLEADCSRETFAEEDGVAGVRVYLEDGRYAVSDEGGRFHFEGLEAGTHVAQLDTFSIPGWFDVAGCGDTPGFAGRSDSQFVKLGRGSLERADFYLRRKPAPEGQIDVELRSTGMASADQVGYELRIDGTGNVPISNIDVMVLLPDGVDYERGSMRIDGAALGDPRVGEQVLSMALPDQSGNWHVDVSFAASIRPQVSGELVTRALAKFDSPIAAGQQTPVAETKMTREPGVFENTGYVLDLKFDVLSDELSGADMVALDRLIRDWQGVRDVRISAVGHSDSQPIAPRNRHRFEDNYALSRARANSAAAYIASALELDVSALQVAGRGPDEPVADNATAAGRARNRRVEMVMSGVRPSRPSFLEVTKASSGTQQVDTRGAVPGTAAPRRAARDEAVLETEPAIETLEPGVALLLPGPGYAPPIPATGVSVQHAPGDSVEIRVNGAAVSAVNFDTVAYNAARSVAVSRYKGVDLADGTNELHVVVTAADGTPKETLRRSIYYAGGPVRGEIIEARSVLVADGRTRPVIALRLYDHAGKPARRGMVGGFRVAAPYRSRWAVEDERRNDLVRIGAREPTYRIGADGIAEIELEPTTQSGELTLELKFDNSRDQTLRTWLHSAARDWILVGFAEGTAGYHTLSDNVVAAAGAGLEDEYYDDGRVAFFAKGRIRGDYLLTLAYDSDRDRSRTRNAFETVVDPNRYYPLYADGSEQRYEAPSQRKLYVKLERNQFVALFGDFDSGLSVTDLARYERRFNGFRSDYRGEHFGLSAFAAESSQAFVRDELRGDGTSGLYRLSAAPIVANSESVRLEVRDRFDSGRVLETTTLSRFLDYNLDPLTGTLYFKQPVASRDLDLNPVFIVVEYETAGVGDGDLVAGGRASLRSASDGIEFGVTRIDDTSSGREGDLSGVDLRWQAGERTLLSAEIAASRRSAAGGDSEATAHRVEIEHAGEKIELRAFIREVEDGFGLGYQSAADQGFRRLGIDLRAQLAERWSIDGEAGWQQNLATEDIRNLVRGRLRYQRDAFTTSLGLVHAADKFEDGDTRKSDLAEVTLTQKVLDGRVTLRASGSTALGDAAGSADFPNRYVLGADYHVAAGVDLVAEYEQAEGRDLDATMSRLGVRATPWARAQVDTSVTSESGEFGPRLFASVGLVQGFQLGERWLFDVGVDQTNTLSEPGLRPIDPDRELASGSLNEDFLAIYTGAMYTANEWSANARLEYRNADTEERQSLLFGWYRQPSAGHGLSAGLTLFRAETVAGNQMTTADLKFGWAYRPAGGRWSFLDRLDLVLDDVTDAAGREKSWRVINNFNANRRIGAAAQVSLQYAFKYVRSDYDGDGYTGYTDLAGFDLRRGLGGRWDIGTSLSVYHSWRSDVVDYSVGADVGLNVATNAWLTFGYNLTGFYDADFADARYSAAGPYLRFSIKADQRTLKDIAGRR